MFTSSAEIRVERAVAEFRAARPVVAASPGERLMALPVEMASARSFAWLQHRGGGALQLYVSAPRARVLGIESVEGCLLPLHGASLEETRRLACQPGARPPAGAKPASALCSAAAHLARLALLLPALLVVEASPDDADLLTLDIGDLPCHGEHDKTVEIVTRTPIPLDDLGPVEFVVCRGGVARRDQLALVIGTPDPTAPVPVRVHSACITGDLFGSRRCDCGDQLRKSLAILRGLGGGVLLYLDQEGRGTGIAAKLRAYDYQARGMDTFDADAQLGFEHDGRRYDVAAAMLRALGITSVRLLSNNPAKLAALRGEGIEVAGRIPVDGMRTPENERYLDAKRTRNGHLIP